MKKKFQSGFSLIELLVVVLIVGVLSALAIIGYQAVMKGTIDAVQKQRLIQYIAAQDKFRQFKGKRRYATMQELIDEGLLNESVINLERGSQVSMHGWMLEPGNEDPAFLREKFIVKLVKDRAKKNEEIPTYCIAQDGILRQGADLVETDCSFDSPPYEP